MLAELAKAHLDISEWAASFEGDASKEEVLKEVPNNGMLKILRRNELSDICGVREKQRKMCC